MNSPVTWQETFGDLNGLRQALHQGTWLIRFNKVNGDLREMTCTLNAEYINAHTPITIYKPPRESKKALEDPFYEADRQERIAKLAKTNLSVFDIDKQAWRSMKVENIIGVFPSNKSL